MNFASPPSIHDGSMKPLQWTKHWITWTLCGAHKTTPWQRIASLSKKQPNICSINTSSIILCGSTPPIPESPVLRLLVLWRRRSYLWPERAQRGWRRSRGYLCMQRNNKVALVTEETGLACFHALDYLWPNSPIFSALRTVEVNAVNLAAVRPTIYRSSRYSKNVSSTQIHLVCMP